MTDLTRYTPEQASAYAGTEIRFVDAAKHDEAIALKDAAIEQLGYMIIKEVPSWVKMDSDLSAKRVELKQVEAVRDEYHAQKMELLEALNCQSLRELLGNVVGSDNEAQWRLAQMFMAVRVAAVLRASVTKQP